VSGEVEQERSLSSLPLEGGGTSRSPVKLDSGFDAIILATLQDLSPPAAAQPAPTPDPWRTAVGSEGSSRGEI